MIHLLVEPNPPEIETLLLAERNIVPEVAEFRGRALERARTALPRNPRTRIIYRRRIRQSKVAWAVAAAVLLFAFGAVAFHIGHQFTPKPSPVPAVPPKLAVPAVEPAATATADAPPEVEAQTPLPPPRAAKSKISAAPKSVIDTEAYALELRVLQPAQRAVAQQEFASALAVIADHQRRFPSGHLAEEREALRVKALLGLGRTVEAQRTGAAFREHFPRSALLGRIDEMLGTQR